MVRMRWTASVSGKVVLIVYRSIQTAVVVSRRTMLILRRISLTSIAASIGSVWPVVVIECTSVSLLLLLLLSFFFFFFSCLTRSNCLLRLLFRLLFLLHLSLLLSWYHQVIARVAFALLFRLLLLRRVTLNRAVVRVHQSAIVPFVSESEKLVLLSRVVSSTRTHSKSDHRRRLLAFCLLFQRRTERRFCRVHHRRPKKKKTEKECRYTIRSGSQKKKKKSGFKTLVFFVFFFIIFIVFSSPQNKRHIIKEQKKREHTSCSNS